MERKIEILSTRMLDPGVGTPDVVIDQVPFIETRELTDPSLTRRLQELGRQPVCAVFTSSVAAGIAGKWASPAEHWRIFCLGNRTRDTVLEFFAPASVAAVAEHAAGLARAILEDPSVKSVTFFCGNRRREELPGILLQNGIDLESLVLYETVSTPSRVSKEYDGIFFFSPSAVESFFLENAIGSHTICFAIGSTTARSLELFTKNTIVTATEATQQSMMDAALATLNVIN